MLNTLIFFCSVVVAHGQEVLSPADIGSHQLYIKILQDAEEDSYHKILNEYDTYILRHPDEIGVRVERCRYINNAMFDPYEELNPNQEDYNQCVQQLLYSYEDDIRVLNLVSEGLYGDSAIALLDIIIDRIETDQSLPKDLDISSIYSYAAQMNSYMDYNGKALEYAREATKLSDSLNLSYFIASQLNILGRRGEALATLERSTDSTLNSWELNQQGELALELGNSELAVRNFRWAERIDSQWISHGDYAQALIEEGFYTEGRKQLKRSAEDNWSNSEQLFDLFEFDLEHMPLDTAVATYESMLAEDWTMDAFGISRLRLFYEEGYCQLKWRDLRGPVVILLVVLLLFIIPYLWILPIYSIGIYWKKRNGDQVNTNYHWGLRHFWWLSFGYLLVSFGIMLVFYNEEFIRFVFFDLEEMMVPAIDKITSYSSLFFCLGLFLVVLCLVKKEAFQLLNFNKWGHWKSFGLAFASLLLLKLVASIFIGSAGTGTLDLLDWGVLSAQIEIQAMLEYLGVLPSFLLVALLVPIYEEYMFRGVILSSCEKYLGFAWANFIQASLFAIIHYNFEFLIFYFAFGFIAGLLRYKSQSLVAPIYLHILNNAFVILILAFRYIK